GWLEVVAVFHSNDVFVPHVASQGSAVADVEIASMANSHADAQLGVEDRVAARVLNLRVCHGPVRRSQLLAVEHGLADEFGDGCYAAARKARLIAQAHAVAD